MNHLNKPLKNNNGEPMASTSKIHNNNIVDIKPTDTSDNKMEVIEADSEIAEITNTVNLAFLQAAPSLRGHYILHLGI